MDVAILFSGGKDSTMALYNALKSGENVRFLLSMKSRNDESYMFHVPNIHLTDLLSQALDIPILSVETNGIKEEELKDLKDAFIELDHYLIPKHVACLQNNKYSWIPLYCSYFPS